MATSGVDAKEIQGIIISGYGHLPHSAYLFLEFGPISQAKAWIATMAATTTVADWGKDEGSVRKPDTAQNVAFTHAGLKALGFPPTGLATFSEEFTQGMTEPSRSRRLGDTGQNAPASWEIGGPSADAGQNAPEIQALLILQAHTPEELISYRAAHRLQLERHGLREVAEAQEGFIAKDSREHFGFRDSISQPEIAGSPKKPAPGHLPLATGEFLLGYPNSYGRLPPTPTVPAETDVCANLSPSAHDAKEHDFGRNGSYLVFRKLAQDVAGFRRFFRDRFPEPLRAAMAAKCVGRWQDGSPLTLSPNAPDPHFADPPRNNAFSYRELDAEGFRCPVGSHVRRTNPRDALRGAPEDSLTSVNRHRLIRRGASYGDPLPEGQFDDDGKPRGLLFFSIGADIKRQFEFVQQTWVNDPKFRGLYNDPDPLIGTRESAGFTIQAEPIRDRIADLPNFVTVRGGAYFFLPGISALYYLAGDKKPA